MPPAPCQLRAGRRRAGRAGWEGSSESCRGWAALGTADDLTQYPGQQYQGTALGPSIFQHRGQRSGPSAASAAEMPGQAWLDVSGLQAKLPLSDLGPTETP